MSLLRAFLQDELGAQGAERSLLLTIVLLCSALTGCKLIMRR